MGTKLTPIEKEWNNLLKKEDKFISARMKAKPPALNAKLDPHVPAKLRDTLNIAFNKAFEVIFEKGSPVIEKTYNKEKQEMDFKVNEYAASLKPDKKHIKKFGKNALKSKTVNMAVSCVSGVGLGFVGVGIPDIPIFTASIFKSIYETALSFGYDYENEKEKAFILRIIETAMKQGVDFARSNSKMNKIIDGGIMPDVDIKQQMKSTAQSMTDAMIYMKFLQGIFVVGAVGGAWDVVYMNRITDYAILKYKRRFLAEKMKKSN